MRSLGVRCEATVLEPKHPPVPTNRVAGVLTRRRIYLELVDDGPDAARTLERDGVVHLPALLDAAEVAELVADVDRVYQQVPPDDRNPQRPEEEREDYRYEMFNRSAAVQRLVADRRLLDVVEPLLGEDCHVIANTAWRNAPRADDSHGGTFWHTDAGPHVPRPAGVPWDDRIPYPVFAVAMHVYLQDCPLEAGPTEVIPGSHRSGRPVPLDRTSDDRLTCDARVGVVFAAKAGDVVMFASDAWHRRHPPGADDPGRDFVQIHYGRRDLAQRIRPTSDVNHLSRNALERARAGDERARTVVGLHGNFFYDG